MRVDKILFFLLIILLPTQLGYHFWPSWSMVLGRRVDYLSPTLYVTDLLLLGTVGSYLFHFVLKKQLTEFKTFRNKNYILITLFVMVFALINIQVAASSFVAIYRWMKFLEFTLLAWYIVRTKPKLQWIVFALGIGVIYSSLLAIGQFVLQRSINGPLWWLGERTFSGQTSGIAQIPLCLGLSTGCPLLLRVYGTFPHPNVLAGFLVVVIPLCVSELMKKTTTYTKTRMIYIVSWLAIILGGAALALTFSRSAWVVGVVTIASVVWARPFKKFSAVLLGIFSFGVIMLGLFFPDSESVLVRKQLFASAFHFFSHSPLFGIGLGNFLVRLPEVVPTRTIYFLQPVHMIYMLILTESGLVGLMLFLILIYMALKNNIVRVPLFALLVLGFVDHYTVTLQQGQLLLTLLLGLSFIQPKK